MQFLAKFKKILHMGFRATLNFRKFNLLCHDAIGNLLCHENNTNMFTSDWAVF